MAKYSAVRRWHRWAGSESDLIRVFEVAHASLLEAVPDTDQSDGSLDIEIDMGRRTTNIDSIVELHLELAGRLRDVRELTMRSRRSPTGNVWGGEASGILLRVRWQDPAIVLSVEGIQRTVVDGLLGRIGDEISRQAPRGGLPRTWVGGVTSLVAAVGGALSVAVGVPIVDAAGWGIAGNEHFEAAEWLALVVWIGVPLAALGALVWLTPALEIVDAGRTRMRRFGKWLGALFLGVVCSLIATVIVAMSKT